MVTSPTSVINKRGDSYPINDLFCKYQAANHDVISEFISSIPPTLQDAVSRLVHDSNSYPPMNDIVLSNRVNLQKCIEKFHLGAGTMTPGVRESATLLSNRKTRILASAHQPNLFAYSGVFKKMVLLHTLKHAVTEKQAAASRITAVDLFLIADNDFLDETWLHLAQLPSPKHTSGVLELRFPASDSKKWQMVSAVPIPERVILDRWREQVSSWISNCCASLTSSSVNYKSQLLSNFEEFWQEVEIAYSKAKSYADFNSFLMSQIVNKIWGYDTLFVRLNDIAPVFEDGFKYLLCNFKKYSDSLKKADNIFLRSDIESGVSPSAYLNAPVWIHCNKCGGKASVNVRVKHPQQQQQEGTEDQKNQHGQNLMLEGSCNSCKRYIEVTFDNDDDKLLDEEKEEEDIHRLSPRAIPLALLLSRELGITCYVSGTAGIRYLVYGSFAFKELSVNIPLTLIWPSKDIYYGIGQSEALELAGLTKHSDVVPYIESLKQKEAGYTNKITTLIAERSKRINAGEPIQTLLSEICDLKEECIRIRHLIVSADKVKNAVNLNPCFIDYAVNFGMAYIEKQWRQNLLNNDNLSAPIIVGQE
jgi:hypothetical protein